MALGMAGGKEWCQISSGVCQLRLALDANSGDIIAHVMTDQDAGEASQAEPLRDQIWIPVGQFTADSAYGGKPTYDAVTRHVAAAAVVIPPRANAADGRTPIPLPGPFR